MKLFPATLKGATLIWFMGLGVDSVTSWDNMKQIFFENIRTIVGQETRERKSSKCPMKEEEILEDYVEHLQYNLHRSKHSDLDKDILKKI
jgi:hypothetical protein